MNEKQVFALGFFDGVHLGHGALLTACRLLAQELGACAAALSFDTHPDALVSGKAPALLNTAQDRARLMKELYGVEQMLTLRFDRALMQTPWQVFFQQLQTRYHAAGLVCGQDFRFGDRGQGTAALLEQACAAVGLPCVVVPEQRLEGQTVSSTYIRQLLRDGELERANRFLGHPHVLTGTVIQGRQLGRTLGTPTANLALPEGLLPLPFGVYGCRVHTGSGIYLAATNVGTRPTVNGHRLTVEAWLLDFAGDLYGQQITVEFLRFLRPEIKFASVGELQTEIQKNARQIREILGKI